MAESFILFDPNFESTDNAYTAKYIVLTNPTKAINEEELYEYWFNSESDSDEVENINDNWAYYCWDDSIEKYLPLTDNVTIEKLNKKIGLEIFKKTMNFEKLNKVINSSCLDSSESVSTESESNEANTPDFIPKKYKLSIILENDTIIEPNFTSANLADFAGMIELMSSERYFAENIKSIKIE